MKKLNAVFMEVF